jgi:hypothetical protein
MAVRRRRKTGTKKKGADQVEARFSGALGGLSVCIGAILLLTLIPHARIG